MNWIKLKCIQRQEFVLVGYTESKGQSGGIGALVLGVYDEAEPPALCGPGRYRV